MKSEIGTLNIGGETKAQVQIIDDENAGNRIVNLYSKSGVFLCSCNFEGDDETGFKIGQGLFYGYFAGWTNCQIAIGKNVTKALYDIQDNMKI